MVELVARYLSFRKQVSLQGIGTFSVEQLPARLDFPNRLLHAPQALLHFSPAAKQDEEFEQWASEQLHINHATMNEQQQILLTDFQHKLNSHQTVEWKGIGLFSRDENKLLHFTSAFESVVGEPVKAEKIIRKNAEHVVRVGEEEKTSTEMEELLFGKQKKKINSVWLIALALLLIGIAASWYYASVNPVSWKMQGNGQKLKVNENPARYKIQ
jgi:nucleoid DNA-binding protein